jgi:hypothetical protein
MYTSPRDLLLALYVIDREADLANLHSDETAALERLAMAAGYEPFKVAPWRWRRPKQPTAS